jgi:hypothetical protein
MAISEATAEKMAVKLQEFRGQLPNDEKEALDGLLRVFGSTVARSREAAAGAQLTQLNEMLDRASVQQAVGGDDGEITPTITTATVLTTVASHPVITCT